MNRKENLKHKTAITRKTISSPMKFISKITNISGHKFRLDYGCGKGFDADAFKMEKYDSYFNPTRPRKKYDLITCIYVLNVCSKKECKLIIADIKSLLKKNGEAYIAVRRDIKEEGFTRIGTFQRLVRLNLPIVFENSNFCIYKLTKE